MYDLDAIEAINIDQLATATDLILLRGQRTKRRGTTGACRSPAAQPPVGAAPRRQRVWSRIAHAAVISGVFSLTAALVGVL